MGWREQSFRARAVQRQGREQLEGRRLHRHAHRDGPRRVLDRGGRKFNLYTATKQALLQNTAGCWNFEGEIDTFKLNGYASTVRFAEGNYFTVFARTNVENTISDTKSFFWLRHAHFTGVKNAIPYVEESTPLVFSPGLSCFPNPVDTRLYLSVPDEITLNKLVLRDINGKTVYESDEKGLGELSIDFTAFKSGFYLLTLETAEKEHVLKIIKN